MTNNPLGGLFLGLGTITVSLTSVLEYGTTLFGFIGAMCGAVIGVRSVYSMIKDELGKKSQTRRKTDKN